MDNMKDITTATFGLVIAYLLPGLFGLFTASFWLTDVTMLFNAFSEAQSTAGLFLLVVLFAFLAGVQLTAFRWFIFERFLCRRNRLESEEFATLRTQDRIAAWRAAVDENFRYHQFWGGMTLVIPFFFLGFGRTQGVELWSLAALLWFVAFLVFEAVTVLVAMDAYDRYVKRTRAILKEG